MKDEFSLTALFGIIKHRQANPKPGSYTNKLLGAGTAAMAQKVGEEAVEVVIAALGQGRERLISELADLHYHVLVLMAAQDITLRDVEAELARRHAPETGGSTSA